MRALLTALLLAVSIFAARAMPVTLEWDPNIEWVDGYRLYWGFASRTYTSTASVSFPETRITVDVPAGVMIYFAVTAFRNDGAESDFSEEISYLRLPVPGIGVEPLK